VLREFKVTDIWFCHSGTIELERGDYEAWAMLQARLCAFTVNLAADGLADWERGR